jgi:hypothetical protein
LTPPSKPLFKVSRYSVTRSTRRIAAPQLCAMSLAFDDQGALGRPGVGIAVAQQPGELVVVFAGQGRVAARPVDMARRDPADAAVDGLQAQQQRLRAEGGQRIAALEVSQVLRGGGHAAGCSEVKTRPKRGSPR